jgi:hypothetical protein
VQSAPQPCISETVRTTDKLVANTCAQSIRALVYSEHLDKCAAVGLRQSEKAVIPVAMSVVAVCDHTVAPASGACQCPAGTALNAPTAPAPASQPVAAH